MCLFVAHVFAAVFKELQKETTTNECSSPKLPQPPSPAKPPQPKPPENPRSVHEPQPTSTAPFGSLPQLGSEASLATQVSSKMIWDTCQLTVDGRNPFRTTVQKPWFLI